MSEEEKSTREKKVKASGSKDPHKGLGLKKLDAESFKLLIALRDKANKKDYGRRVRDSEILALGLSLIEAHHLEQLKAKSLSEQDKLKIAHSEYQKENGKISMDAFIGKLLRGEVKQ